MVEYALRFISGKYQGGEFPLPANKDIFVGRSSDLDMVLVEDMVSRKHAHIRSTESRITIKDLGSTNGTFVNGEKITETELAEGDRILIGTSILKLVRAEKSGVREIHAKQDLSANETRQQSTMSGTLEEVPVPDLLQLFSTSKRTGVLKLNSEWGHAKLHMRNGDIFYASINDDHELGPLKAFGRIVGWNKGTFEFRAPEEDAEFMIELEDSTEALLMEAMRQLDELRRRSPELPASGQMLEIPRPLEPSLSELDRKSLEIFQIIHNFGLTQLVFDRAPFSDLETADLLIQLIERNYVIAVS